MRTLLIALFLGATVAAQSPRTIPAPPDVKAPPADAVKTATGLASKVIKAGTSKEHPARTDMVTVHYTGWTTDGKMFDSSVARGETATFPLDKVIAGWTEGVQLIVLAKHAACGFQKRSPTRDAATRRACSYSTCSSSRSRSRRRRRPT